ncbi:MAG: hypothetical protein O2954_05085 [bacterium]|nr:hypothetical protein [bacterium]
MNGTNGRRGNLYDQVLEHARREIDEASSKIEELRRTLRLLEARVEAAKSVYEAVAARLNLEDELEEESEFQSVPYPEPPPPVQALEPPEQAPEPPEQEEEEVPAKVSSNGSQNGFSMDLIRRHLEKQASETEEEEKTPEPVSTQDDDGKSAFPELSDAEMRLIKEHMRSRAQAGNKE